MLRSSAPVPSTGTMANRIIAGSPTDADMAVTVNAPARAARTWELPTAANSPGRNFASTAMITSGTATRLSSSAANTATSGTSHSTAVSGRSSPRIDFTTSAATPTWSTKRQAFHAAFRSGDLRIQISAGTAPTT